MTEPTVSSGETSLRERIARHRGAALLAASCALLVLTLMVFAHRGSSSPAISRAQQDNYVRALHHDLPTLAASLDPTTVRFGRSVCNSSLSAADRAAIMHESVNGLTPSEVQAAWAEALVHMCPRYNYGPRPPG